MRAIPHVRQQNDYYCGPAVLEMVLSAYGTTITQDEAAIRLHTTEQDGTSPEALVQAFQTEGFVVTGGNAQTLADVEEALTEQKMVVVCYTEPPLEWDHYSVVRKIADGDIFIVDPMEEVDPYRLSLPQFENYWHGRLFTRTDHWAIYLHKK